MDAFKFCKEFGRMCKVYCEPPTNCDGCPMNGWNTPPAVQCTDMYGLTTSQIQERIGIVEKWSKEHPAKTMAMDFFEKFPNAPKKEDGTPIMCPSACGYEEVSDCNIVQKCVECWNRPLEDRHGL